MDLIWKGMAGGAVTMLIAHLSKQGATLPGILPLFPTFSLIALLIMGARGDLPALQETCLASAKTLPAYLAFLLACYFALGQMDYRLALLVGLAAWGVMLGVMFGLARLV
ncbi:inner membrane protein YdgC [Azorhizobium oxalatiphilum]|uniref:Inner membrane protein YdgC n=1 Tax=Azorhizobium oxalatiphilum TaxID=980631 RepID=A0A917BTA9_9HYPH|nr:GlpM family protein [Azorhizobium oxalatiphilum]GGF57970.1 inner membrane protein YdgC [Azorhizobium oxalatiphilum]